MSRRHLLLRLLGRPKPEDQVTESLAFLIEYCPEFRRGFAQLIWKDEGKGEIGNESPISCDTQQGTDKGDGRYDLKWVDKNFVVVIESKIDAKWTDDQPGKYLGELDVPKRDKNALVVIAPELSLKPKIDIAQFSTIPKPKWRIHLAEENNDEYPLNGEAHPSINFVGISWQRIQKLISNAINNNARIEPDRTNCTFYSKEVLEVMKNIDPHFLQSTSQFDDNRGKFIMCLFEIDRVVFEIIERLKCGPGFIQRFNATKGMGGKYSSSIACGYTLRDKGSRDKGSDFWFGCWIFPGDETNSTPELLWLTADKKKESGKFLENYALSLKINKPLVTRDRHWGIAIPIEGKSWSERIANGYNKVHEILKPLFTV